MHVLNLRFTLCKCVYSEQKLVVSILSRMFIAVGDKQCFTIQQLLKIFRSFRGHAKYDCKNVRDT